jgi:hypothetical protein
MQGQHRVHNAPATRPHRYRGHFFGSSWKNGGTEHGCGAKAPALVETLLCKKKTSGARAFIASRIGKRVLMTASATASDDLAKQAPVTPELIDSLQREGTAWDADLIVAPDEITLKYMSDEACVQSRTLRAVKGQWRIVRLGDACD